MNVRVGAMCRGEGKGYVEVILAGASAHPSSNLVLSAKTDEGREVNAYLLPDPQREGSCVVVFPLLETRKVHFVLDDGAEGENAAAHFAVSLGGLKWRSRLNYRLRSAWCDAVKKADGDCSTHPVTSFVSCSPVGDRIVWRFSIELAGDADDPTLLFSDLKGDEVALSPELFEDQIVDGKEVSVPKRIVTFSLSTPESLGGFCVDVPCGSDYGRGLFCVDETLWSCAIAEALHARRNACDRRDYLRWRVRNRLTLQERKRQSGDVFSWNPLVSIVVPLYRPNGKFFVDMVESVLRQTYGRWELVLVDSEYETSGAGKLLERFRDDRIVHVRLEANRGIAGNTNEGVRRSRGELIGFLDYDDMLSPDAVYEYVKAFNACPDAWMAYSDEDVFERPFGYKWPAFKPDFNRDLLYSNNYITHWLVVNRSLIDAAGLSPDEVSGAQDYDLSLKASEYEKEHPILHIPKVLYHWRIHGESTNAGNAESKPYAHVAGKLALEGHFARRGIDVEVEDASAPFVYRCRYQLPRQHPRVDIVIPSKDHVDVLDRCVSSLLEKATYDNFSIIVVENNSVDAATFEYYDALMRRSDKVRVVTWQGEFNYAQIINYGVSYSEAEYVLLLNNDTEVISPDFIEEMLGYLQRPEVGVVGAKLYFKDGLVQHAGMLIGPGGTVVHVNQNVSADWPGYLGRSIKASNYSSVTGACQLVRRSVFDEVGGYSEEFAVGFNDADFCCKVRRAGYLVVFTPFAELHHYEFTSRGREANDPVKLERWSRERDLMQRTWPRYFDEGDPCSNPNFDRDSTYFSLPAR